MREGVRSGSHRTAVAPQPAEPFVGLEVFVVRAEIVAVAPRLDDVVQLQGMHGFGRPARFAEPDVGINPGDVFPVLRQPGYADIEQVLLAPYHCMRPNPDMAHRAAGDAGRVGELKRAIAVSALDGRQPHPAFQHVPLEVEIQLDPGLPAQGVGDRGDDVEQVGLHAGTILTGEAESAGEACAPGADAAVRWRSPVVAHVGRCQTARGAADRDARGQVPSSAAPAHRPRRRSASA